MKRLIKLALPIIMVLCLLTPATRSVVSAMENSTGSGSSVSGTGAWSPDYVVGYRVTTVSGVSTYAEAITHMFKNDNGSTTGTFDIYNERTFKEVYWADNPKNGGISKWYVSPSVYYSKSELKIGPVKYGATKPPIDDWKTQSNLGWKYFSYSLSGDVNWSAYSSVSEKDAFTKMIENYDAAFGTHYSNIYSSYGNTDGSPEYVLVEGYTLCAETKKTGGVAAAYSTYLEACFGVDAKQAWTTLSVPSTTSEVEFRTGITNQLASIVAGRPASGTVGGDIWHDSFNYKLRGQPSLQRDGSIALSSDDWGSNSMLIMWSSQAGGTTYDDGTSYSSRGLVGTGIGSVPSGDSDIYLKVGPDGQNTTITAGKVLVATGSIQINTRNGLKERIEKYSSPSLTIKVQNLSSENINVSATSAVVGGWGFAGGSITITDKTKIAKILSGEYVTFISDVVPAASNTPVTATYIATATWKLGSEEIIVEGSGQLTHTGTSATNGKLFAKDNATWAGNVQTWEYHTAVGDSLDFYAEIKANECKSEDWEVLSGIPATENLFVAAGGDLFQVDVGGTFVRQDNVERTTTFNVTVTNMWGDNTPCSLSCPGHSASTSGSTTATTPNGTTVSSAPCSLCGTVVTATGQNASAGSGTVGMPGYVPPSPAVPATNTHTCSMSITYNCSTGTASASGSALASYSVNSATLTNGQLYVGTATARSKTGQTITTSSPSSSLIDEGYTSGKGCTHSHNTNMIHNTSQTFTYVVKETIDKIYYLNIRDYAVYGLYKAAITNQNSQVVTGATGQSVGNQLYAQAFDLSDTSTAKESNYSSGNGRIMWTLFCRPLHKSGPGWTSTSINSNYWAGDAVINISVICDGSVANYNVINSTSIKNMNGTTNRHWGGATSTSTAYQSGHVGDRSNSSEALKTALCAVNGWSGAHINYPGYSANIVSDGLTIGIQSGGTTAWQNIVSSIYSVDEGIFIFGDPFTETSTVHVYNHTGQTITKESLAYTFGSAYNYRSVTTGEDILRCGYTGNGASNPSSRYGSLAGNNIYYGNNSFTQALYNISNLSDQYSRSTAITRGDTPTSGAGNPWWDNVNANSFNITMTGSGSGSSYAGYYGTHTYPANISSTIKSTSNLINEGGITNSSSVNYSRYGTFMVMSNIDMVDTAPNTIYTEPVTVTGYFTKMLDKNSGDRGTYSSWPSSRKLTYKAKYSDQYTNYNGTSGVINDIIIQNPVSTEYCEVISNTDSSEDMRTGTHTDDYWMIGDYFDIFYSDYGDFYDEYGTKYLSNYVGTRGMGTTGNSGYYSSATSFTIPTTGSGYMNGMDTSRWVASRWVKFPAAVFYYNSSGTIVTIPAGDWINLSSLGGYSLQGSITKNVKGVNVGGKVYRFYLCTSSLEMADANVQFNSVAKNTPGINPATVNSTVGGSTTNKQRGITESNHNATTTAYVDLVGRIGNLSIQDTGDFRFSNLFKQAESSWLISGVIKNVDLSKPYKVASTLTNILNSTASDSTVNHSTLSTTFQSKDGGTVSGSLIGKSGKFVTLPLTADDNNIAEYGEENIKLGYSLYMDIETIGNYYGYNTRSVNIDSSLVSGSSPEDETTVDELVKDDTDDWQRTKVMTITPYYLLLDMDTGKYYPVNIYFGDAGNRTACYKYGQLNVETFPYTINFDEEMARRNVTAYEKYITQKCADELGNGSALTYSSDYIGSISQIVLDQFDRTFIGSSVFQGAIQQSGSTYVASAVTGANTVWQNSKRIGSAWVPMDRSTGTTGLDSEFAYALQSQRWHFTLGLPSTAYVTEAFLSNDKQTTIEQSHSKLQNDHPNSVLVTVADIKVQGDIWELEYKVPSANQSFKVVSGGTTYAAPNTTNNTSNIIDLTNKPVIAVLDAWKTASEDLDIKGTH